MELGQDRQRFAQRAVRLIGLVQVVLLAIAFRYWWIQVAEGETFRQLADDNRLRHLSLEASRGLIYDRHGRQLVENVPGYALLLDRSLSRDLEASLAFAGEILGVEPAVLRARIAESHAGRFQQVRLAEDLSLSQVARFAVEQLEHPELEIAAEHQRLNRHGPYTAHLMGYLGRVTRQDLETPGSRYQLDDVIGRKGIEGHFEDRLRGRRGEQLVVVDSRGRLIEKLAPLAARPGNDLVLTIDLELQQEAARLLEGKRGAVVALDPENGDLLALVSSPAFDPNAFARGLSSEAWEVLRRDPGKPLQNRALQPSPPGSVFKIVMAAAGLDSGLVDASTRAFCSGSTQIYGHRRRCWKAAGHGWEDLEGALRDSCDIFFYQLGQRLGIEAIAKYSRMFGLGRRTGLEIGGEAPGLIPDVAWSEEVRGTPWYPGETISVAIGQGPILVTPLQMAVMVAALARGHLVTPRLDLAAPARHGARLPVSPRHLETVRRALAAVVNDPQGTGRAARIEGLKVAGKTGTAQVVRQETWTKNEALPPELRDHAWFAAFAPVEDPRLVVVVFVENGGAGSQAAAPLAKALLELWSARERAPAPRPDAVVATAGAARRAAGEAKVESP